MNEIPWDARTLYTLSGVALFGIGLFGLVLRRHLIKKVIAVNVVGSGVFLVFVGLSRAPADGIPDPVPQAMVLTGVVVAVSATALALTLIGRLYEKSGETTLSDQSGSIEA